MYIKKKLLFKNIILSLSFINILFRDNIADHLEEEAYILYNIL
jgi:hypothetical protein